MSTYSRLFGASFPGHDEQALRELADRMKDIPANRRGRRRGGELVVSGLVYFGQFIDHDLTRDNTDLPNAAKPPEGRINARTPRFDLDSVYGEGPRGTPDLYDHSTPASERFLLGDTEPVEDIPSTPDDIPLRSDGVSAIADDRNEENLFIAQLHVAFLQFHNRVLHDLTQGRIPDPDRYGSTAFERAQQFVTWHYQWIVCNEFLPRMVLDDVLADIQENGPKLFKPKLGDEIPLPVEFTHAAFRFGHSMVQNAYRLSQERVVKLKDLVKQTAPNQPRQKLKATDVLDWYFFLMKSGQLPNFADNIDTLIAEGMYALPQAAISLFSATPAMPLPAITLLRGSRIGLPSGQEACALFGEQPLPEADVAFDAETRSFLERNEILKRTPLWYYILREAEVLGAKKEQRRQKHLGGECLGPLGSRIVAEVLLGVMNSDRAHYLNATPKWEPPYLVFGESRKPRQIGHLRELISFAKSDLVTRNAQMF